jgi:hypothetical protein
MVLAALLAALALFPFLPRVRGEFGPGGAGASLFWLLPAACAVLSVALFRTLPPAPGARGRDAGAPGATLRLLPWIAAGFVADQAFVGIGYALGWSTFTFGDQRLMGSPISTAVWGVPLCLLLGVIGFERALRGAILGGAAGRLGVARAAVLSSAVGVLLAAPSILLGTAFLEPRYIGSAFVAAACREASFAALYLAGGILPAGLYRGVLHYTEGMGLNDVNALFFPATNYVSSHPLFYLLRGLCAAAAAVTVLAGAHVVARGEGRKARRGSG